MIMHNARYQMAATHWQTPMLASHAGLATKCVSSLAALCYRLHTPQTFLTGQDNMHNAHNPQITPQTVRRCREMDGCQVQSSAAASEYLLHPPPSTYLPLASSTCLMRQAEGCGAYLQRLDI